MRFKFADAFVSIFSLDLFQIQALSLSKKRDLKHSMCFYKVRALSD
jgi:hypothetical protein